MCIAIVAILLITGFSALATAKQMKTTSDVFEFRVELWADGLSIENVARYIYLDDKATVELEKINEEGIVEKTWTFTFEERKSLDEDGVLGYCIYKIDINQEDIDSDHTYKVSATARGYSTDERTLSHGFFTNCKDIRLDIEKTSRSQPVQMMLNSLLSRISERPILHLLAELFEL